MKTGPALIYATSPQMELVASFRIASVVRAPLSMLWQSVHDFAGVTRREFQTYFSGLELGVAIHIADISELRDPLSLAELRKIWKGFHPPQGFRYVDETQFARIHLRHERNAA